MNQKKETDLRIRLTIELKEALKEIAQLEERGLSQQAVYFLKQAVKKYKDDQEPESG